MKIAFARNAIDSEFRRDKNMPRVVRPTHAVSLAWKATKGPRGRSRARVAFYFGQFRFRTNGLVGQESRRHRRRSHARHTGARERYGLGVRVDRRARFAASRSRASHCSTAVLSRRQRFSVGTRVFNVFPPLRCRGFPSFFPSHTALLLRSFRSAPSVRRAAFKEEEARTRAG